eukprot:Skav213510  [mRNA]  locus=scaffold656:79335:80592:+ [translate_table: standard]
MARTTSRLLWKWGFVSAAFGLAVDEIPWVKELKGHGLQGEARSSNGCFSGKGVKHWGAQQEEGDFEGVGSGGRPAPLLVGLHSQGDQADDFAASHDFGTFGKALSFISVYPQGLDDAVPGGGDMGTGWNVGTAGDEQTCVSDEVTADCYASCFEQGKCGSCNWSGCYDERLFVYSMIQAISSVLCIDQSRVYVMGESNGGMLAHYLVQSLPGTFAAVAPWYGLPLLGYGLGAEFELVRDTKSCRQTAMLQLHGRQDDIMPPQGGVSSGFMPGWIYEPLNKVQQGWAAVHECDTVASEAKSYWDGGKQNFGCFDYKGCSSGRRIMRCFYDGGHGDLPAGGVAEQITVWFLLQNRLDELDEVEKFHRVQGIQGHVDPKNVTYHSSRSQLQTFV